MTQFSKLLPEFVLLLGIISILPLSGCNCHTGADEVDGKSISEIVDFGIVGRGQSATYRAWLRNPAGDFFHITDIETSCECLEVILSDQSAPAHGKILGEFVYAGEEHPDFLGCLEARVLLKSGERVVGVVTVQVEVAAIEPQRPIEQLANTRATSMTQETSVRRERVFFPSETSVRDTPTLREDRKKGTP